MATVNDRPTPTTTQDQSSTPAPTRGLIATPADLAPGVANGTNGVHGANGYGEQEPSGPRAFSFEWFSSLPAYQAANRDQVMAFLSGMLLAPPWQGVDVACGVGLMTELCHQVADRIGAAIQRTVCVDMDFQALEIAREKLADTPTSVVQSVGQRLPLHDNWGSFFIIGNGIHNFAHEDKLALMREAFRVLRGGASLFFNSAFYEGATVKGTERFYTEHIKEALRSAMRTKEAQAEEPLGEKPEAVRALTPAEYVELVREAGFTDIEQHEVEVRLDQELWEAISNYGAYAQGALHFRYSAEVACRTLRQAVRNIFSDPNWLEKFPGMEENGERFIPRQWLWVTARKPILA